MQDKEPFFLVPKVAGSAARLQGKRRVMCEISDFFGLMGGHHATLAQMKSTAGILMSLGITEFVSMYTISLHPGEPAEPNLKARRYSAAEFRTYTDYVERVNRAFSEGERHGRVAVLHPIVSLWAHFTPSERSMYELHPNEMVRFIDDGFANLCRDFLRNQIDYDIVDERSLVNARIEGGRLVIGELVYDVLVLPPMDTIRVRTIEKLLRFVEQGGAVLAHPLYPHFAAEGPEHDAEVKDMVTKMVAKGGMGGSSADGTPLVYLLSSRIPPECILSPSSPYLLCTTLSRKGTRSYFLVNTSSEAYRGTCTLRTIGTPSVFDPETGKVQSVTSQKVDSMSTQVDLSLPQFTSLFVTF